MEPVVTTRMAMRPSTAGVISRIGPVAAAPTILPSHTVVGPLPQPAVTSTPPVSLPLLGSLAGHLLKDRVDPALTWYLPAYAPAADPDVAFGFVATQLGVDSSGNPFNKGKLTLRLAKQPPPDAAALAAKNPRPELREVALTFSIATLDIVAKDPNSGSDQHVTLPGAVTQAVDGSLTATFDNILGKNVIILFENLRVDGAAILGLSASYSVWREQVGWPPRVQPLFIRPVIGVPLAVTGGQRAMASRQALPMVMYRPPTRAGWVPPAGPTYTQTTTAVGYSLPLEKKYAADAYLAKYTIVTSDGVARPIIDVDNLRNYASQQSEYRELHDLGAVNVRYPSIARLYIGVLSRSIVAIPTCYEIMRTADSCAASCQLLLDAAAGSSGARFQFQFLLAPGISPVELARLSADIGMNPQLRDCVVTMPQFLRQEGSSSLNTVFKSGASFAPGSSLGCFALSVEVTDAGPSAPAIANGNMLIRQLCVTQPPYLSGLLDLRLDDMLADPIQVPLVLNFGSTIGNDGLTAVIDEANRAIDLVSRSSFDLRVRRYALCLGDSVTENTLDQVIKAGTTLAVPLPANHDGLNILIDRDLVFDGGSTMDQIARYLDIRVQDVESIRCTVGINAGAVDFTRRAITEIDATIVFSGLPQIVPVKLTLTAGGPIADAGIILPIQSAIGSLVATLQLSMHYHDPAKPPASVALTVDFSQSPLFVLSDLVLP